MKKWVCENNRQNSVFYPVILSCNTKLSNFLTDLCLAFWFSLILKIIPNRTICEFVTVDLEKAKITCLVVKITFLWESRYSSRILIKEKYQVCNHSWQLESFHTLRIFVWKFNFRQATWRCSGKKHVVKTEFSYENFESVEGF